MDFGENGPSESGKVLEWSNPLRGSPIRRIEFQLTKVWDGCRRSAEGSSYV